MVGDLPKLSAAPSARHDRAAFSDDREAAMTRRTIDERPIFSVWLQDRFLALSVAFGANSVKGLARVVVWLESIDRSAAPGIRQNVARGLCLKLIPVVQLTLKLTQTVFQRRLIALGVEDLIEEVQRERLRLGAVPFSSLEQFPQFLRGFSAFAEKRPGAGRKGDNVLDEIHLDAPVFVEGDSKKRSAREKEKTTSPRRDREGGGA